MSSPWRVNRARIGWWAVAVVLAATVGYVFVSFVGTFVFGLFVYYATRPIYRRLKRVVRPPSLAAGISLVLITLPAILLLAYTIAIGLQEFDRLVEMQNLDVGRIETLLAPYVDVSALVADPLSILTAQTTVEGVVGNITEASAYLEFFGIAALHLFVVILLAFYLLRDGHRFANWFVHQFSDNRGLVETYVRLVDRDYSIIFFGNILNAFLTGIIGAIAYGGINLISPSALEIPYPTLLGLLTGIASLIPIIGIKLVYVPVAGYLTYGSLGAPELLWFPVVFVLVSFVIVDVIPDLVLRPYVSGRGLHLGLVMLAYIFGPLMFGWYGLFLGPMILVLIVHFTRIVLPELVAGRESRPADDAVRSTEGDGSDAADME
ncbi:AI-2E family transporter [Halanaeroarchaeum sulfurireducens]|uniref:Htr-like protein n=1 Tax=Halanaeroarchaeum sulfurireducens TaxID=1604004 RepID=A0A0F7P9R2_9EURY|nr:AI-2E family transporter [Halanaeroarchaeum sulfurireducens]AKH97881.1 Htr-like protein [Halanaeroarchaeum sulfurireducens]ALG82275.1 Htr-like protein [Halanaeroarchaeum sulfurireducens]